jgi:hypothetical protein
MASRADSGTGSLEHIRRIFHIGVDSGTCLEGAAAQNRGRLKRSYAAAEAASAGCAEFQEFGDICSSRVHLWKWASKKWGLTIVYSDKNAE